ncbi:MAG: hypothetical protein HYS81_00970 [Candidatus Aenigmatarchaeota archaeon]|nr:MAG: hypothetical protein HYS81_00970 [Candidatus Aenigmarchaeota archaeon]
MAFDLVLPDMAYQAVHVIALLVGLYGAYWASNNKQGLWTVVFGLWAVTELIYLTVHLNLGIVTAGAAHVIQEALLLIAFLYVVYSAAMKK